MSSYLPACYTDRRPCTGARFSFCQKCKDAQRMNGKAIAEAKTPLEMSLAHCLPENHERNNTVKQYLPLTAKVRLKNILRLLPSYSDGSGWDFSIRVFDKDHSRWRWTKIDVYDGVPEQALDAEVMGICYGWPLINGKTDDKVNVVIRL